MPTEDFISVYRSTSEPYLNSKCLFVEYFDMLAIPWFNVVQLASTNTDLQHLYQFSEFTMGDSTEALEWYITRNKRNVFDALSLNQGAVVGQGFTDAILEKMTLIDKKIFLSAIRLAPHYALEKLLKDRTGSLTKNPMVNEVVIYTEYEVPFIKEYITRFFSDSPLVKYKFGDFVEVVKDLPTETTYMLSDITKMKKLEECGKLEWSSIVLPANFAYNKGKDGDFMYNFKEMQEKTIFKCDSIDVFTTF